MKDKENNKDTKTLDEIIKDALKQTHTIMFEITNEPKWNKN